MNIIIIWRVSQNRHNKLSFIFFSEIQMIKDPCKEPKNEQTFKYQKFKISNPASVGVKNNSFLEEFYPKFQIEQSNFLNGFF